MAARDPVTGRFIGSDSGGGGINEKDINQLTELLYRLPSVMGEQLRLAFSKGIRQFKNHLIETRLSGPPGLRRGRHTSPASWPARGARAARLRLPAAPARLTGTGLARLCATRCTSSTTS